ncbi:MAG: hypothetical protein ACOY99_04985 [Pseudomonadota bacterium]
MAEVFFKDVSGRIALLAPPTASCIVEAYNKFPSAANLVPPAGMAMLDA